MKFTTARRLIKEQKRGAGHPAELLARAHEVCAEHHRKIKAGKAAEAEIAQYAREQVGRLDEAGKKVALLPGGMSPEEFAARQVKLGRQGRLDPSRVAHAKGKIVPRQRIDPEGNPILGEGGAPIFNYDSMGNRAQ